jgi:hypothetical protein
MSVPQIGRFSQHFRLVVAKAVREYQGDRHGTHSLHQSLLSLKKIRSAHLEDLTHQ